MNRYSDRDLNIIIGHFSITEKKYRFTTLTDGYINDTFLVSDDRSPRYILQRVNHKVFPDIGGVMNNIKQALHSLEAPDYSKIILVDSKVGKGYVQLHKDVHDYWRMMTYIPNSITYNTTFDPKIAFEAGRIITKFHALLETENVENYVDTIPRFHDLTLRKEQFKKALAASGEGADLGVDAIAGKRESDALTAGTNKMKNAASAIRFAEATLTILQKINFGRLPVRICHNDTKLNNILFSRKTGKALCLIDLDTLMKGHFLYDFGDAVRTIANPAPEDEQDHSKISFEKPLFEAFIEGLGTHKSIFSSREIETLPWGAVLLPFLHGIRALTDYLNGNIYYKVAYENQNLDRCLSLFDFTRKALGEMEYMENTVRQKLG